MRGQRIQIDLEDELKDTRSGGSDPHRTFDIGLVGDIKERMVSSPIKPPSPPRLRSSVNGFPRHKDRISNSKVKERNEAKPMAGLGKLTQTLPMAAKGDHGPYAMSDGYFIDEENKQKLANMSEQEIEETRSELIKGLSPSLIKRLLERANIDEENSDTVRDTSSVTTKNHDLFLVSPEMKATKNLRSLPTKPLYDKQRPSTYDAEGAPLNLPSYLHPAISFPSSLAQPPNIHFPRPSKAPELDPSDPDFLSALHSTYFPTLPADPSATSWMTSLDAKAEEESAYSIRNETFPPSAVRFDFQGHLLPPLLSSQIPTTKGLHHHANAPFSAGYTISELAHLARSSYPAQRCAAYQTIGRILYRLGRGDFGPEGEDLCEGLWQLMDQGKAVDQLVEAAADEHKGNKSVWATATDAVWLWRKGGGRKSKGR